MKKRCVWGMGIGLCCFILVFPGASLAAEKKFPTKPIQIIVPFQPGETDNVLRPFIEKMPEYLGQPVSFVYKPGAAGAVGAAFVASSKPDGHTLVAASVSPILLLPLTNKNVGYTREAFAPVCSLAEGFLSLAIQSSARWKNLPELVAEAKKDPAKITYASTGTFGISHIAGEAFSKDAGIKLNHIPAQGAGPAVTAMLGGHVDIAVAGSGATSPHLRAGTVRALMVYNDKRVRALPEVPSAAEFKYTAIPLYYGFLAPKGTPREVIDSISLAVKKVLENHETYIEDRLTKVGAQARYLSPEEYAAWLRGQNDYFEKVIKGIKE